MLRHDRMNESHISFDATNTVHSLYAFCCRCRKELTTVRPRQHIDVDDTVMLETEALVVTRGYAELRTRETLGRRSASFTSDPFSKIAPVHAHLSSQHD